MAYLINISRHQDLIVKKFVQLTLISENFNLTWELPASGDAVVQKEKDGCTDCKLYAKMVMV